MKRVQIREKKKGRVNEALYNHCECFNQAKYVKFLVKLVSLYALVDAARVLGIS